MTRRSLQESMHPALPWAWAGSLLVLLVSGRSRSEYATSLAVIVSSFIIFKAAKIPPQRRRVFYLGISLAGFAIAFRLGIALIIGVPMPGKVLFHIPELTLPHFIVGIRIGGALAWYMWLWLHLFYLLGGRNKIGTMADWTWNYLTFDRGNRHIMDIS